MKITKQTLTGLEREENINVKRETVRRCRDLLAGLSVCTGKSKQKEKNRTREKESQLDVLQFGDEVLVSELVRLAGEPLQQPQFALARPDVVEHHLVQQTAGLLRALNRPKRRRVSSTFIVWILFRLDQRLILLFKIWIVFLSYIFLFFFTSFWSLVIEVWKTLFRSIFPDILLSFVYERLKCFVIVFCESFFSMTRPSVLSQSREQSKYNGIIHEFTKLERNAAAFCTFSKWKRNDSDRNGAL